MRVLLIHSDYLKYEVKKETPVAEEIEEAKKNGAFDESLVVFTAVEKEDEKNPKAVVKNLVKEVKKVNEQVKAENVVIYPYAHLSSSLSGPKIGVQVLKDVEEALKEEDYNVYRVPFGWYKAFEISCKGHPLSELSRSITADESEDEEVEEEDEGGEETEYDEHVWLSLKNAVLVCEAITDTLIEIDAENETLYQQNLLNYKQKLNELDALYTTAVSEGTKDTVLFGDRFPFRYLVDDYGLKYYAAFVGCSAESEASFETIVFLAQKIDELSLTAILTLEEANHNIAQTIKNNTTLKNQKIYVMDSMQSVTKTKISSGITYLSIMEQNLNSLKEALK